MQNFNLARINMVDSQIHTMGVLNEAVLSAFRSVRREDFVLPDLRAVAYNDEDLPLGYGRYLMEPLTQARLIQALDPKPSDNALDIGGGTGYSSAILAGLCSKVLAVEENEDLLNQAKGHWAKMGFGNISSHHGAFMSEASKGGLYDIILVNGALAQIPQSLIDRLAPSGRLVCIVKTKNDKIGKAILVAKNKDGIVGRIGLFEAATPYLSGQEPRNDFVF